MSEVPAIDDGVDIYRMRHEDDVNNYQKSTNNNE